jgi:chromosome segregation ATPase
MPSIRTIQTKIETTNEQIRRFLLDIRNALEKINDDTERNARSIGQLRRSIQTKIDKIRSLQEKMVRLKEELNRFKNMIDKKHKMFQEEDIRDLTCEDQLLMYSSVLPSILAEVENIIQNI